MLSLMDDRELTFGEWLEELHLAAGMNQTQFAKAIGLAPSTISGWVNGNSRPRRRTIRRIATLLEVDESEVFRRAGYPPGAAYVDPQERFDRLHEQSAIYEDLSDLRAVQDALAHAMRLLDAALAERGVVIVRAPAAEVDE